jgi:hypothetical protein
MTEWMVEHWIIEAVLFMAIGFLLAKVVCILADFLNRD